MMKTTTIKKRVLTFLVVFLSFLGLSFSNFSVHADLFGDLDSFSAAATAGKARVSLKKTEEADYDQLVKVFRTIPGEDLKTFTLENITDLSQVNDAAIKAYLKKDTTYRREGEGSKKFDYTLKIDDQVIGQLTVLAMGDYPLIVDGKVLTFSSFIHNDLLDDKNVVACVVELVKEIVKRFGVNNEQTEAPAFFAIYSEPGYRLLKEICDGVWSMDELKEKIQSKHYFGRKFKLGNELEKLCFPNRDIGADVDGKLVVFCKTDRISKNIIGERVKALIEGLGDNLSEEPMIKEAIGEVGPDLMRKTLGNLSSGKIDFAM